MRALKAGLLFLFPALASALTPSVRLSFSSDSRNGPLDVSDLNRQLRVSQFSEQALARLENLGGYFSLESGVTVSHPDYSTITLLDGTGKARLLSEQSPRPIEPTVEMTGGFAQGPHTLSLGWKGSVGQSPFASQLFRASATESFFEKSTSLEVSLAYLNQTQPGSYFIDKDFRLKPRPARVNAYEVNAGWDQVLTESWKARLQVGLSRRVEERPLGVSLLSRQAVAISDRLFAAVEGSYSEEVNSQPLQNERGYFRSYGFTGSLTLEPVYDLLLTVSYGVLWEQEHDPRDLRHVQVAADHYSAAVSFPFQNVEAQATGRYVATNTGVRSVSFSGSVLWKL